MPTTYLGMRHSFDGIRLYRSAAAATGADGAFVPVEWDAESAIITKTNVDHDTGTDPSESTIATAWRYGFALTIGIDAAVGMTEARAEIQIDTGGGWTTIASDRKEGSGPFVLKVIDWADLPEGAKCRARVMSVGAAGASLLTGETVTFFSAVAA
jgi:hypothetical protein